MAHVYILYSLSADKYYVGSCNELEQRLLEHKTGTYADSYTAKLATDWVLYYQIDDLEYEQARNIELHIKRMKSRKYIQNMKQYPKMMAKLKERY